VPRLWPIALAAGLAGAVLAVASVALVNGLGPVTERVVERVPVSQPVGLTGPSSPAPGVPAIASAVGPSVVRLEVATGAGTATGSGVVLRDDGTILTNAHVVDGATGLVIVLADGTAVPGYVAGADPVTDVAVVRPEPDRRDAATWVPAVMADAAGLEVGETAIAIGSPSGAAGGPSVTVGVVSGLGRRLEGEGVVLHGMIQTDAPIAGGSSGGALCDGSGVVVGITTAFTDAEGGHDLAFAIPIEVARAVAEELLGDGGVDHAWLGIEGADLAVTEASLPGVAASGGVRVVDVAAGGPAASAGLAAGDVVVALDGRRIRSMSELVAALRAFDPGTTVTLDVVREGASVAVEVVLGER